MKLFLNIPEQKCRQDVDVKVTEVLPEMGSLSSTSSTFKSTSGERATYPLLDASEPLR